jgi:hypothetical protein
MKNKYLGFYSGFVVFALPIIMGDMYRHYKQKKLKTY